MIVLAPEVAAALDAGRPVVALESTLLAHGLPRPDNLAAARELERLVRDRGAVPATVAVLDGAVRVGLDDEQLRRITTDPGVVKASLRDLPVVVSGGLPAATTVASTAWTAAQAGITTFATGGLGGVHRGARDSWDVSADLVALAQTPVVVVCSGVKSILDVPATLEHLESVSVTVLGYRTARFPGFYVEDAGLPVPWRVDSPAEVAVAAAARDRLGLRGAVVVAQPGPAGTGLDRATHDRVLSQALEAASTAGIHGRELTPYLLDHLHRATGGASVRANLALVRANAALAAEVALALTAIGEAP